jgi:hypothetical protein
LKIIIRKLFYSEMRPTDKCRCQGEERKITKRAANEKNT